MKIKWYSSDKSAKLFYGEGSLCARLVGCKIPEYADMALRSLGSRRRTKWTKTNFGYEAKVRINER